MLCGLSRSWWLGTRGKLSITRCRSLATESTDEWSKWEFNSFGGNSKVVSKPVVASSVSSSNTPKKFDHVWSQLSADQVESSISALKAYTTEERVLRMESVLDKRTANIRFVFDNPTNMNNVWAALRTFDSFGLQFIDIISDGSTGVKYNSNKMIEALGTQKWLTLTQYHGTEECISYLKSQEYRVVATDLHSDSKRMQDIEWCSTKIISCTPNSSKNTIDTSNSINTHKIAIVVGNEKNGISSEMRTAADQLFYIPMKGFAESFNLSVACAVICSHLESTGALNAPLSDDMKRRMLLTWLSRSVDASVQILRREGILTKGDGIAHVYEQICGFSTKP